jgi:hypothetical protein
MSAAARLLEGFPVQEWSRPEELRDWILRRVVGEAGPKFDQGAIENGHGMLSEQPCLELAWEEALDLPMYLVLARYQQRMAAHLARRGSELESIEDAREVFAAIAALLGRPAATARRPCR